MEWHDELAALTFLSMAAAYRRGWGRRMSTLGAVIRRLQAHARNLLKEDVPVILAGDYNVAPTEINIYPTTSWDDDALVQPESRSRSPTVVPKAAITDPARINLWAIEKAPSEAAYAMIERIGSEPFIRNFGALKAHEDETGILSPARSSARSEAGYGRAWR